MAIPFWRFPSGREGSVVGSASGAASNHARTKLASFNPDTGEIDPGYQTADKAVWTVLFPSADPLNPARMQAIAGNLRSIGWMAVADNANGGGTVVQDNRLAYIIAPAGANGGEGENGFSTGTIEATYGIDRVVEWFEVYFKDDEVAGSNLDPNWGGPAVGDVNPPAIGFRTFQVVPVGAVITATIAVTAAYGSASATSTSVNASPWVLEYGATLNMACGTQGRDGDAFCDGAFGDFWEEAGPLVLQEFVDAHHEVRAVGASAHARAFVGDGSDGGVFQTTTALSAQPNRRYRVRGHLKALDQDYPGSLPLSIYGSPPSQPQAVTLNPTGDALVTQRVWAVDYDLGSGPVHLSDAYEAAPIKTALGGLAAAGEDPRDWVTMASGKTWGVLRVKHDGTHAEPTPALSGGVWRHDYPPFPTSGNWEGYAFLRVVLKTDAADEEVTILAAGRPAKAYKVVTTGTGYTTFDVDLLAPLVNDAEDDPDLWDDRNVLTADGLPLKDPSAWGIGAIESLTLSGGTNLVVQSVALVRKDAAARLTALVSFLDWSLVQNDESYHYGGVVGSVPIIQGNRCVVIDVDGRRSIVEPCSLRQLMSDGSGGLLWVYGPRSAKDLETTLNACPGFSCDNSPYTLTDYWHCYDPNEVLAVGGNLLNGGPMPYGAWSGFVATGGAYWNGSSCAVDFPRAVGDAYQVLALQARYHEIDCYPNCGDCWGDSGGGYGEVPFRVAKVLRGAVDGVALDEDGTPIAGAVVTLKNELGATVSTATTDSMGRFRMGAPPYGKGQKDHSATLGSAVGSFVGTWDDGQGLGSDDATQERWNARRLHRAAFRAVVVEAGRVLALLSRGDGAMFRAIDKEGSVHLQRSDIPTRQTWVGFDLGQPADEASLERGKGSHILVGLLQSGTLNLYLDASEGRSPPIAMASYGPATSHDTAKHGDGTHLCVRIDGGAIKTSVHNDRDLSLVAGPFTAPSPTGLPDDATVRVREARLSGNKPGFIVAVGVGSDTQTYLTTDLKTLIP